MPKLARPQPLAYRAAMTATPMTATATLIPLDNVDPALVEELLDRAFGADRHNRTAYKLRDGTEWLPALSFAAMVAQDQLVGSIQCWPVALTTPENKRHPMIMVGPVAVLPEHQGAGYGQALVTAAISALSPEAPLPQVMIGDPDYYGRFWGFTAAATGGWDLPGPFEAHRLLARGATAAVLPAKGTLGPWRS